MYNLERLPTLSLQSIEKIFCSSLQVLVKLIKKLKSANQKLLFYNVNRDIIEQIENLEGVDTRTLRATSVIEALKLIEEKNEIQETSALLNKEHV